MNIAKELLIKPARWNKAELAFWIIVLSLPFFVSQYALLINEIAVVALFALSLDLILGFTGIVSLGHAAFLGFGAYVAGLFAKHVFPDPIVGLLVASLSTALLGLICSFTIIRGSDLTRLMVTLAMSLILFEMANKFDGLTGGADGLQGITIGPLMGIFDFDLQGKTAAVYSLVALTILFYIYKRLVNSPFGASLKAIRDNPIRAKAIGIPVTAFLAISYTLSAAVAGVAGALLTQSSSFVSLDVFSLERSADVLLILVIGGVGWLYGGIIGAVIFKILHSVISDITPQYWIFWAGLFLVLLVLVDRGRLVAPLAWLRQKGGAT
ncbi:branched-chain amino acid ABC transporter permease [Pusillimonas sp. T2]|uniref:branched-chain amino acid ABC transporter permease n=1 Tax=Pusillimonas sp. T2 TaxID=1548123 RepID=UPI000B8AD008|nr:branched-chain amino acid ABC transporter permease [Pusillimonas sp. T2]OXR47916.1 branched-chain amino acid ABC transporter permease [Pusillimonas sp. T2]